MDDMEREVAPPGGGFWFGSAGFWGEEDYRGFVDSYKPDNLINVRMEGDRCDCGDGDHDDGWLRD